MLEDRGYQFDSRIVTQRNWTREQFTTYLNQPPLRTGADFADRLSFPASDPRSAQSVVAIYYSDIPLREEREEGEERIGEISKASVTNMQAFLQSWESAWRVSIRHVIMVNVSEPASKARGALAEMMNFNIELFTYDELCFNCSRHAKSQKHRILYGDEFNTAMNNPKVPYNRRPIILTTEMVARYYNMKEGDLVSVEQKASNPNVHVQRTEVIARVMRPPINIKKHKESEEIDEEEYY